MKKKMPSEGLRLGRDSGSILCDTLKKWRFRTGWGGNDCCSRLWLCCLILLFALTSCEKSDTATIDGNEITTRTVTAQQLIGDWTIQSALVPVGTLSADIAWEGSMMEFSADSVRIHRLEYVYHTATDGGLEDVTIATYPVTYDKDKVCLILI